MLCSHEDVSFNNICLNVLEGIKQFYLSIWFKKKRLETPFKGDNKKTLIKCKIVKMFISREKSENCSICFALLVFSDQTIA